jgi:hypothetical protein
LRIGKKLGIIALTAFLRAAEMEQNYAKRRYENCPFSTGILIQFEGNFGESVPLIYRKLSEFLSRNPLSVLKVSNSQA